MDFLKVIESVANKLNCNFRVVDDEKKAALIQMPLPTVISLSKSAGGLQWFKIVKMLGKIVDLSAFNAVDLLRSNAEREAPFAILDTKDEAMLTVVHSYAISESEPENSMADILFMRTLDEFDVVEWSIPGVTPISSL